MLDATAIDLSQTKWPESGKPMFNVTVLTERNNPKLKKSSGKTLHPIHLDWAAEDLAEPGGKPKPFGIMAHENKLIRDIVFG